MSIYEHLRKDILNGAFDPGEKLKLESLRSHYHAGTNALRESLSRLSSEGLVEAEDQKGFRIAKTSQNRLSELTRFRTLIEIDGAIHSIRNGGLEWESNLVAAHHRLGYVEEKMHQDPVANFALWSQYDWEFHETLLSACGSELHKHYHKQIFDQFRQFVIVELKTHGFRGGEIVDEHEAIVNAAVARDEEATQKALQKHIGAYLSRSQQPE